MTKPRKDLRGDVFGRLTIIDLAEPKNGHTRWMCKCECGNDAIISQNQLKSGKTRSCGCLRSETTRLNATVHGASKSGKKTRAYKIWAGMKARCAIESATGYENYGAKGVTVCERWLNFENFITDMGEPPEGTSIDRIESSKGYEPGNCRWATRQQQNENRKSVRVLTFNGMSMNVTQWARHIGVSKTTLYEALEKYPLEYALRDRGIARHD